jgi:hypothetical protein
VGFDDSLGSFDRFESFASVAAVFSLVAPGDPSVAGDLSPDPPLEPSSDADAVAAGRDEVLRSFFAQPLPLKWMDGALNALRTGAAPQTGQDSGAGPVTEWMTSNRCPFGQR